MQSQKRRLGDRRDGQWLRDLDAMHAFTPYLMPNRTDNEAFIKEDIDLTAINAYLEKLNTPNISFRYTFFHIILSALVKTVALRPRMNRFISGRRMYQRNELSAAFVIKKQFNDNSHEALAFLRFTEQDTLTTIHDKLDKEIHTYRKANVKDNSTDAMDTLVKLPRFLLRIVMGILFALDFRGKVPYSLIKADPNYATLFISNLGSIKLNAAYHHLNNWGTNSVFVTIGEKRLAPYYDACGNVSMRETLSVGFTLDERIADGYYYAKTIKLFKYLLENPELLELPAKTEVNYE